MKKEVEKLIKELKECAARVYEELGAGWGEEIYQKAMEVALREKGIKYEAQRTLPITFNGYVVGKGFPDLIVWYKKGRKKIAIIIELKSAPNLKVENQKQVERYMQELKKELKKDEEIYPIGFVFDFTKPSGELKKEVKNYKGLKILEIKIKN